MPSQNCYHKAASFMGMRKSHLLALRSTVTISDVMGFTTWVPEVCTPPAVCLLYEPLFSSKLHPFNYNRSPCNQKVSVLFCSALNFWVKFLQKDIKPTEQRISHKLSSLRSRSECTSALKGSAYTMYAMYCIRY